MAASQARVFLLTSRKSDLELQAQFITQEKMLLSMQTEEIANEYTKAINNKVLKMNWYYNNDQSQMMQVDLTYSQLTSSNNSLLVPAYRICSGNGDIIIRDKNDPVLINILYIKIDADKVPAADQANYDQESGLLKIAQINNSGIIEGISKNFTCADAGRRVIEAGQQLDNKELFQNALRQGTIFMEALGYTTEKKEDSSGNTVSVYKPTGVWGKTTWQGSQDFSDDYYTEDDAVAEAQYQAKMYRIESKDKILDNELKQIETLHNACKTELDDVKSVLKNNIEKSFKIFS